MVEISIVPFKYKHLELLHEMLKSQKYFGIEHIEMKTLPKLGYIALLNNQPIAAGFLRRLEPCYAQIDTLCSNAHFGSAIRHQGVSAVVDALLQSAKDLKLKGIISFTQDAGVLKRAKELGFHEINQSIIAISIDRASGQI